MRLRGDLVDDPRVRRGVTYAAVSLFFFLGVQLYFPAPVGVLVQGIVIGGLTALIAFGIALIYRSNRIINFAQGELGGVPASLAILFIVGPGVPYILALPIAIAAALVLGGLVEFLFIRRFFKAPRLVLTVVTIGLSQLLAVSGILLPNAFNITTPPQSFPSPFDWSFAIGQTIFRGNDIIAMLAVPAAIVGLAAFFRYTNVGIAVRASAENADRAYLLGINVKRIQTIVWVVATLLSTLAIFMRAGIVGLPIGRVLGPSILLRALAAAVMAKMENLPTIFGASVLLGVLETAIIYNGDNDLADPILFLVVLGALLFQRRRESARNDEGSSWQAAAEVRPVPPELIRVPEVRWGRVAGYTLVIAAVVLFPVAMTESQVGLASVIAITAMVALSLVVLTGWAGQVSLGQIAFMGIGAAVGGYLTFSQHWDLALALVVAGIVGALAATLIGLPALRIRGIFLSVVTLAFALATSSYLLNQAYVSWLPVERFERPLLLNRISVASEDRYYYFIMACLVAVMLAVRTLRNSRTGRTLIGVRENERAAQSYGVSAVAAKLQAFAISGFIAAFAGALFIHHQQSLGIQAYGVERSFQVFIITVVGGIGTIPGAVLGAVFVEGFQYFRNAFPPSIRNLLGFITGPVGVILILMLAPGGLAQIFYNLRDTALTAIAKRRGIDVPSLTADRRADEKLEVGAFEAAEAHAIDDAVTTAEMEAVNGNGRRKRKTSAAKAKAKGKPRASAQTGARR